MEEKHYGMHIYQYKKKHKQCEIPLTDMSPISSLTTPLPPLTESVRHTVGSILDTDVKGPLKVLGKWVTQHQLCRVSQGQLHLHAIHK